MMSKALSTREKWLLLVLAVLLVVAVYYLFVIRPTSEVIAASKEQIATIDDNLIVEEAMAKRINDMKAELSTVDRGNPRYAETPDYDNIQNVLDELSRVFPASSEPKINFSNLTFNEQSVALREIQISFVAGSYSSAKQIIQTLYSGPYRCDINRITIRPTESNGSNIVNEPVTASVSVIYYEIVRGGQSAE